MRRPFALALVLVLAGCSGGEERQVDKAQLRNVVLQSADLGSGFQRFEFGPAAGPQAQSTRREKGHEGGWTARYRRVTRGVVSGPLIVVSSADVFSGDGADRYFDGVKEEFGGGIPGGPKLTVVDAEEFGDESVVVRFDQAPARFFTVLWRDANVVAFLLLQGRAGGLEADDALRLARAQQSRIEKAAEG